MEPTPAQSKRSFWCFISYRHADNQQAGRQWATWLHQALETYEVPADLVGRPNLEGELIPERIYPVFRDEEELPADADLSRPIISALQNSRCLLVICSPRACESRFVADEIARFKAMGKSHRVIAVHFDPIGRHVASASADGEVKCWDASSGTLLATLPHPTAVTQCVFSADGASLLTTCNDRIARLWDLSSSSILASFPRAGKFNSIAISPDQSTLAIAGEDGSIRLYDWQMPRLISRSTWPADRYEAIAQAVTGSEITASGNLHRLTFEQLTNAKARADSLSPTAQPEADLWKATRPSGVGK